MKRRHFLHHSTTASLLGLASAGFPGLADAIAAASDKGRRPRILLRNGWQSQNIGDVAHYHGMFELLRRHGIDVEVRFWASNMENGADELFRRHYPDIPFFHDKQSVDRAFEECDFFLHGSCSGFGAWRDVKRWRQQTGKSFGVMGISLVNTTDEQIATLSEAAFVYFRDGVSAEAAVGEYGLSSPPAKGWGPDTAFGVTDLANDEKALAYLKANDLEPGQFLCCIPRYRWTPFWTLRPDRAKDETKHARNEERKDPDHAPHREAIIRLVREAGVKVLITHEDQTQIALGKEILYDPLPDDVKAQVVWRDHFWQLDEAVSVYRHSLGLFGNEMHSPILCIANGIPALVGRWDEQTNKGFMWRNIGLDDWLITMDDPQQTKHIPDTVLSFVQDPETTKNKVHQARQIVLAKQKEQFDQLRAVL